MFCSTKTHMNCPSVKSNHILQHCCTLKYNKLEIKDTCIIHIRTWLWSQIVLYDINYLENQDTLIIWTVLVGPKVSIIHRFHRSNTAFTHIVLPLACVICTHTCSYMCACGKNNSYCLCMCIDQPIFFTDNNESEN